jgi:hypothetical protein
LLTVSYLVRSDDLPRHGLGGCYGKVELEEQRGYVSVYFQLDAALHWRGRGRDRDLWGETQGREGGRVRAIVVLRTSSSIILIPQHVLHDLPSTYGAQDLGPSPLNRHLILEIPIGSRTLPNLSCNINFSIFPEINTAGGVR